MKNSNIKRSFNIINSLAVNESQLKYPVDQKLFYFSTIGEAFFKECLQHRVTKDNGYRAIFRRFTPHHNGNIRIPSGVSFIAVAKMVVKHANGTVFLSWFNLSTSSFHLSKAGRYLLRTEASNWVNNWAMRFLSSRYPENQKDFAHNTVLMMLHTLKPIPRLSPWWAQPRFWQGRRCDGYALHRLKEHIPLTAVIPHMPPSSLRYALQTTVFTAQKLSA